VLYCLIKVVLIVLVQLFTPCSERKHQKLQLPVKQHTVHLSQCPSVARGN